MLRRVVGGVEQQDPLRIAERLAVPCALQNASRRNPRDLDQALAGEAQVLGDAIDAGEGLVRRTDAVLRAWLPIS